MIKTLVVIVVVGAAAVLVAASRQPDEFRVVRSATVKAPREKVFAIIEDFARWPDWSPWEKLDPAMKRERSGAARGKGAVYAWDGAKVGAGRMEILEADAPAKVLIKLDFLKPFEAHNTAEFDLAAEGPDTRVTWAMSGRNTFIAKVMHVFMDMDKMIGGDFEKGLANMQAAAGTASTQGAQPPAIEATTRNGS